jgi:hypothetical protein
MEGDWSDTKPKPVTDRTDSILELLGKYEELNNKYNNLKNLLWNAFYDEKTDFFESIDKVKQFLETDMEIEE